MLHRCFPVVSTQDYISSQITIIIKSITMAVSTLRLHSTRTRRQSSYLLYISDVVERPDEGITEYFREKGLIQEDMSCSYCNVYMEWTPASRTKTADRFIWKCPTCKCTTSVRNKSILHKKNLSFRDFFLLMASWSNKQNSGVNISELAGISEHSTSVWRCIINDVIAEYLMLNPVMLGGWGIIVEIDESMFGKRKYNRGRRRDGVWVFGMVERGTNRCFLIPVENRTKDTLVEIVKRWVRPGSIIMSDGWSSYKCLKDNRFNHLVVNHTNEYKDPFTGAHTNTIEGLWMHAKRGINGNSYVTDALLENMWRKRFSGTAENESHHGVSDEVHQTLPRECLGS